MAKLFAILVCLAASTALAQRVPVPCGPLPESSYGKCLKESRDRNDRAQCAALLEFDMKEIDDWQQCRVVEIEAEAAKQKDGAAAAASQARALLMMRVRSNASR